ncbi:MAG TPA: hypothetical protein PLW77_10410 [Bacteroidales bacterium]|mgnify:CR=1 FL=1|nr:hypothetical protein [Bacteroidales bacterium]HQB21118.1 hypothetical protein [Bacteroidales bacterium]
MITQKAFWISYDLGLKGDYSGLYTWLDTVKAKECGNGIAFFSKAYKNDFIEAIKNDIKKFVKLNKTDRVYLIYRDNETKKIKGKFLFGGRKRAPWEGFATGIQDVDEDFV